MFSACSFSHTPAVACNSLLLLISILQKVTETAFEMLFWILQVGVIREIIDKGGKKSEFHLNWFYRPEEAMGGRKVGCCC
jgi:hypothetical protein